MFLSDLVVSRMNVLVLEVSCTVPPRSTLPLKSGLVKEKQGDIILLNHL